MGRLDGKVCVITGAAGGIGAAACALFGEEGATVVGVDLQEMDAVDLALTADVADEQQVAKMYAEAHEAYGRIDVLFNNAGISPPDDASVLETDLDVWERVQAVNLRSVFLGCKHGIPHLQEAGGGSIINIASFVALMGCTVPQDAYTASKGGVLSLTRSLAVQYGKQGIRANAICPGPVLTPLLESLFPSEEEKMKRLNRIPMGRFGRAEDIVWAGVFLASDESSWMTGSQFVVDGGITVNYF